MAASTLNSVQHSETIADISDDCAKLISEINFASDAKPILTDFVAISPLESGDCSSMHSIFMFLQNSNDDIISPKDSKDSDEEKSSLKRLPPGLLSPARMTPLRSVRPARLI